MSRVITYDEHHKGSTNSNSLPLDDIKMIFQQGDLFVYPTETLYGLGANPFDDDALEKLYSVKNRPKEMPVSIAVSDIVMMEKFGEVNDAAMTIAKKFLPGPVTLLLSCKDDLPKLLSKDGKAGFRIPNHPVALKIIENIGPITATSANIHGQREPHTVKEAIGQLGDDIKLYIDCGEPEFKGPSTIVDCTKTSISIIREGVIGERELKYLFK